MDLTFLAQADQATLKLELARHALEAAKGAFESAKLEYDDLLAQSDTHGFPRAKLKKLTEERWQGLMESGLVSARPESTKPMEPKRERARKSPRPDAVIVPETWSSAEPRPQEAEIAFLTPPSDTHSH